MSALGRLAGAWLRQRSPTRRVAAWVLAVAGPALLTLAALPLRSSLVLGGFLFSARGIMPAELDAARFTGTLWAAIRTAGGPGTLSREHRHFAGAFDPGWLASLPLPAGEARPAGQPVALLDARHEQFERHTGRAALARAYVLRPRTRVLEDIAHGQPGTWHALAARHLTRLSGSDLHVTCSIFCSRYGDETFGRHRDAWYGAVVQMTGTKDWLIGECLLDGTGVPRRG